MRLLTIIFLFLSSPIFAQMGHDEFDAGEITATADCETLTVFEVSPPKERPGYQILYCRTEVVINGQGKNLGYSCDPVQYYETPTNNQTFEVRRRVFWKSSAGTFWRTTPDAKVKPQPCNNNP